jgi:phosphoribosylamine--glycine ligase
MDVLVVGSGAREHALAWRLSLCPSVGRVWAAPGNPGMEAVATCVPLEGDALAGWASAGKIDLVVVGPEAPLADGLADRMRAAGLAVLGPSARAAEIEASKAWAKAFCLRHGIPAAASRTFADAEAAAAYAAAQEPPVVVKADGLAAGKGVVVAGGPGEAAEAARALGRRGRVVVEEFLRGRELSAFALCDGRTFVPLAAARDHKRRDDGDRGPNTGGMGAYSPVPEAGAALMERVAREVFAPAVAGLAAEGRPYVGVLYAGLMLTAGGPRVLEFNARLGDPEAQVLLPRWQGDVALELLAAARGDLSGVRPDFGPQAAVGVVLASPGYPEQPRTGLPISGIEAAARHGALVFHAATRRDGDAWATAGGRVLTVVALGSDVAAAREAAYRAAGEIVWPGRLLRGDIAGG